MKRRSFRDTLRAVVPAPTHPRIRDLINGTDVLLLTLLKIGAESWRTE